MKNKGCLSLILYSITIVVFLSIIALLMPLIFLGGIFGLWFYTKKRPNIKKRNYSIIGASIGLIGTILLGVNSPQSHSTTKSHTKIESNQVITLTSSKKSNLTDKNFQKAEFAINEFEKVKNQENLDKAIQAFDKVKDSNYQKKLEKRFTSLKQAYYIEEANVAIKNLEETPTKNLVGIARQKASLVLNASKKEELSKRIETINQSLDEKASQELALSNAESAVKKLEEQQIRENILNAQNSVTALSDEQQKEAYNTRINAVIAAIETKEAQEKATSAINSAPQQFAQNPIPSNTNTSSFANCTQMRNAGLAPIPQGQAGYASHLDRDHDGWACE